MTATQPRAAENAAMERLAFGPQSPYAAIEAAIHLGRYLLARPYCAGRRVLDIACGEGYGAYLMAEQWGAASVVGVDVAPEAIAAAQRLFPASRVTYRQGTAEGLRQLFPEAEFDLIVSLETIEHLQDPQKFLAAAARVLRPGGIVIISCPNDHWYYRTPEESNPFHVRKYTVTEFQSMAEEVLGRAAGYLLGTPVSGFMNLDRPAERSGRADDDMRTLLAARDATCAMTLPTEERITAENCRYFVGVWGPLDTPLPDSAAVFPASMDGSEAAHRQAQVQNLRDEVVALRTTAHEEHKRAAWLEESKASIEQAYTAACDELRGRLQTAETRLVTAEATAREAERVRRHSELRVAALRAECDYMRAHDQRPYIRWLEQRAEELDAKLRRLEGTLWWRTRRLVGRLVKPVLRRGKHGNV